MDFSQTPRRRRGPCVSAGIAAGHSGHVVRGMFAEGKKKESRKKTVRHARRSRVYIARTPPPLVIILCVRRSQPKRVVCAREFRRAFVTELVFPAITLRVKIYAPPCSRPFRRELVSFYETTTKAIRPGRAIDFRPARLQTAAAVNYQPYEWPLNRRLYPQVSRLFHTTSCLGNVSMASKLSGTKTPITYTWVYVARGPLVRNPRPDGGSK